MKFNLSPIQKKLLVPLFIFAFPLVCFFQACSALFLSLTGKCDNSSMITLPFDTNAKSKMNWFDALGNHVFGLEVEK